MFTSEHAVVVYNTIKNSTIDKIIESAVKHAASVNLNYGEIDFNYLKAYELKTQLEQRGFNIIDIDDNSIFFVWG